MSYEKDNCVFCGKRFVKWHPHKKFCTIDCYTTSRKKPKIMRYCNWCGTLFIRNHNNRLYCTPRCRRLNANVKQRDRLRKISRGKNEALEASKRSG